MCSLDELRQTSRWLQRQARNVTSQAGEDGILLAILGRLPQTDGWCVEVGAWDGRHLSNTFNLVGDLGYKVVLIECDLHRYERLVSTYPFASRAVFIQRRVGFSPSDSLDNILQETGVPANCDLLSIDVDGNDYHVWASVTQLRPKIVIIEYNPTIANSVWFVQPAEANCAQGSSAKAICELAARKGYEMVATTALNLVFVERQYYAAMNIPDNSLEVLRDDSASGKIFFGYDGSVFVAGEAVGEFRSPWHGVKLIDANVQVLPTLLRKYPGNYSLKDRILFSVFALLNRRACSEPEIRVNFSKLWSIARRALRGVRIGTGRRL
jgi:hypothetical protein